MSESNEDQGAELGLVIPAEPTGELLDEDLDKVSGGDMDKDHLICTVQDSVQLRAQDPIIESLYPLPTTITEIR